MVVLLVGSFLVFGQANQWNGITPLKTTRDEVERLLGVPTPGSRSADAAFYIVKSGRVFILYSSGPCKIKPSNGWNVPALTVIKMSWYPDEPLDLSSLKLDEQKFKKRIDPEMLHTISYTNDTEGLSITVDTLSKVATEFQYFPGTDKENLKCKPTTMRRRIKLKKNC